MGIKFFRRFFLSHSAENFHFLREPFNISQILGIGNKVCFRELRQYFLSRLLLSHTAEKLLRSTFLSVFRKFPGSEKVYG